MRKLLLLSLLLIAGTATAQQSVQTRPGDGGVLWFDLNNTAILPGHVVNTGKTPVVSACGGAAAAVTGTDQNGSITVGATPTTTCTITFALAFANAPACVLGWANGPLAAMSWTASVSALTITQTSTATNVINYTCGARQ